MEHAPCLVTSKRAPTACHRQSPSTHPPVLILLTDTQVEPLIQVFGLYLTNEAALDDMREPTIIASRAMRSNAMPSEAILGTLESAVKVAAMERAIDPSSERARALRESVGPWLLGAFLEASRSVSDVPLAS